MLAIAVAIALVLIAVAIAVFWHERFLHWTELAAEEEEEG